MPSIQVPALRWAGEVHSAPFQDNGLCCVRNWGFRWHSAVLRLRNCHRIMSVLCFLSCKRILPHFNTTWAYLPESKGFKSLQCDGRSSAVGSGKDEWVGWYKNSLRMRAGNHQGNIISLQLFSKGHWMVGFNECIHSLNKCSQDTFYVGVTLLGTVDAQWIKADRVLACRKFISHGMTVTNECFK